MLWPPCLVINGTIDNICALNLLYHMSISELSKLNIERIFQSSQFLQPHDGEPIRSVVTESADAIVVAWYILPQQEIPAHIHPHGQDTWMVLSGRGDYYLDRAGNKKSISVGDIVIAPTGSVHGVFNTENEPLIFISIVSPATAGYELLE
jgi:quercetin dioxygenase-like cupin family protein